MRVRRVKTLIVLKKRGRPFKSSPSTKEVFSVEKLTVKKAEEEKIVQPGLKKSLKSKKIKKGTSKKGKKKCSKKGAKKTFKKA